MQLDVMALHYGVLAVTLLCAGALAALTVRLNALKRTGARLAPSAKEMWKGGGLKAVGYLLSREHAMLYDPPTTALVHLCRLLLSAVLVGWVFSGFAALLGAQA